MTFDYQVIIGILAVLLLVSAAYNVYLYFQLKKESGKESSVEDLKNSERSLRELVEERTEEINKINIMLMDRAIELGSINQISEKVNSSLNMDEVINSACGELTRIFPLQSAGIAMLSRDNKKLVTVGYHSVLPDGHNNLLNEVSLVSNGAFAAVVESGREAVIEKISLQLEAPAISETTGAVCNVLVVPVLVLRKVIGVIYMIPEAADYNFNKTEIDLARTIAVQVAGSVENARLFSQKERALNAMENELEIGRQIQSDFFPSGIDPVDGWEVNAHFKAARQVSGDFYDVFKIGDKGYTALVVGDVCDKGVGAALFMVLFRSLLRAYSLDNSDSGDLTSFLHRIVLNTNNYVAENHGSSNMFAALFFGILDPERNRLYYINAGLEAPVLLEASGKIINRLQPASPVIGMFPDIGISVNSLEMNPGDSLLIYTDGTTDTKNDSGELFGEQALLNLLSAEWTSGFSLLYELNAKLDKFAGEDPQYDDITQLVLRRKNSPAENKHSISRAALLDNLEELRGFVEKASVYSRLPKDAVFALKLASEEICTNIIKYAYEQNKPGKIIISFEVHPHKAVLRIYDFGKRFIPAEAAAIDTGLDLNDRKIGGLGIQLVREYMDVVDYIDGPDGGNCVILEKKY